ncbi:MAG: ABC transporter permease [Chloroflexi bacterium]|nr:ABC transporter permease [Chloroflexota bacterium]
MTTTYRQKLIINVIALVAVAGVFAILTPRFLTDVNLTNVLRNVAPVVIVGSAFTLLMVARGLDLSVGSVIALSGCIAALAAGIEGLPLPIAFLMGIAAGAVIGLINAVLTVPFGINAVIATLGTLYVARGTAQLLTGGVSVYGVGDDFDRLGNGSFLGIANPIWVMLIVVVVFMALERFTLLGRYAVATGSNPEAAFLSGVPGRRIQATLYVLTGAMAGLAGVLLASRLRSGQVNVGVGFEFDVIVATILGGTSLAGGEGTVSGMLIGALIVGILANGLNLIGVPAFWQTVAQGVVLVLAVGLDVALRARLKRRRRAAATGAGAQAAA